VTLSSQALVEQLDTPLGLLEPKVKRRDRGGVWFVAEAGEQAQIRTRALAAVHRLAPPGSTYVDQARAIEERGGLDGYVVRQLAGVVPGLREDYVAGYVQTVEESSAPCDQVRFLMARSSQRDGDERLGRSHVENLAGHRGAVGAY
jgi:hypothetical protein